MNGLADQPIKQHSARFRCSAVEAKRVLVQVIIQMRTLRCSLVSSEQPSLQKRSYSIGQGQKVIPQVRSFPNHRVFVAQRRKSIITPPPVRMHFRPGLDHPLHGGLQTITSRIGDLAQANSANALFGLLRGNDDNVFPPAPRPRFPERSPPMKISSTSTTPESRSRQIGRASCREGVYIS